MRVQFCHSLYKIEVGSFIEVQDMRLCVFPNDPIYAYYEKGEIKPRYFNPCNKFDHVDIISFTDSDIEESKVQSIVGDAKLKIHSVGKITLTNRKKIAQNVLNIVKPISPDIIRTYNCLLEGWIASVCASTLKIPFFVSLHTQYDHRRKLIKKSNFKKYMVLKYTEKFIEPHVLQNANKITMVYKIIEPYVTKHCQTKPELLYNRVDYNKFSNGIPVDSLPKPLIISVGNLIPEKYHECVIEAMQHVNAHLLIIGSGPVYDHLMKLISSLKLENKVTIKKSVPYNEIQNFYKSAQIFALAYDPELEGLPMPVMEAMAAGLPIIIPPQKEGFSEGLEDIVVFSKRDAESFAKSINMILSDINLQKTFSEKSQKKAIEFDSTKIEKREAEIYHELLGSHL